MTSIGSLQIKVLTLPKENNRYQRKMHYKKDKASKPEKLERNRLTKEERRKLSKEKFDKFIEDDLGFGG